MIGGARVHDEVLLPGDRVLFGKKSRRLDVENGDLGTVQKITGLPGRRVLQVVCDDGRRVEVPTASYRDLRLGYAITTHKSQGMTNPYVYVLAGGSMQDWCLSYVQASRSVESTRWYMDRFEAGPGLSEMVKTMSQDGRKQLAVEVQAKARSIERGIERGWMS
jgi:ATP-dependent exoDNAse (exonuclease V) alpha subunit